MTPNRMTPNRMTLNRMTPNRMTPNRATPTNTTPKYAITTEHAIDLLTRIRMYAILDESREMARIAIDAIKTVEAWQESEGTVT